MAATVTVRQKAFSDPRIGFLGALLGCSWSDAFARVVRLWSVCAEQQTDTPEVRHIRACLESLQGEQHLVACGLADEVRRDPQDELVVRVRGCDETDWYYAKIEQQGRIEAGRARARAADRDVTGKFRPPDPEGEGSLQRPSSGGPASSLSGSSSGSEISACSASPELPESGAIVRAERGGTDSQRRELVGWAWNYAARRHHELKSDGVDKHALNCWSGTNLTEPRKLLRAIVDDLTQGDAPDFEAARKTIANRIEVAAAEARSQRPPTLRWFTPMRMWNAESFARCAEVSPAQVGQRKDGPNGTGTRRIVVTDDDPPPTGARP